MIAKTPEPPYYAVIFTSVKSDDHDGYDATAMEMVKLAEQQPGFLGVEGARNEVGITVSYWRSEEDIQNWKNNMRHTGAQKMGKDKWCSMYKTRVCKVERDYGM